MMAFFRSERGNGDATRPVSELGEFRDGIDVVQLPERDTRETSRITLRCGRVSGEPRDGATSERASDD